MPLATATAQDAGTYEVALDFDVLIEIGDRAIVREGSRRLIVARRGAGDAGGVLPLYDWRPEDVRRRWLVRVSESTDQAALDVYTKGRQDVYFDALDAHGLDLHAADLRCRDVRDEVRERVVKIVQAVENLRTTRVAKFFRGPSDQTRFPGSANWRWWNRVRKINEYVTGRLEEARIEGRIEPVSFRWQAPGRPNHLWEATS